MCAKQDTSCLGLPCSGNFQNICTASTLVCTVLEVIAVVALSIPECGFTMLPGLEALAVSDLSLNCINICSFSCGKSASFMDGLPFNVSSTTTDTWEVGRHYICCTVAQLVEL